MCSRPDTNESNARPGLTVGPLLVMPWSYRTDRMVNVAPFRPDRGLHGMARANRTSPFKFEQRLITKSVIEDANPGMYTISQDTHGGRDADCMLVYRPRQSQAAQGHWRWPPTLTKAPRWSLCRYLSGNN